MRNTTVIALGLMLFASMSGAPVRGADSHTNKRIHTYLMCVRRQAVKLAVTRATPSDIAVASTWACRKEGRQAMHGLVNVPGIRPSLDGVKKRAFDAARAQVVWARLCHATTACEHMPTRG